MAIMSNPVPSEHLNFVKCHSGEFFECLDCEFKSAKAKGSPLNLHLGK